jgi:carbon storage regulator CsrA
VLVISRKEGECVNLYTEAGSKVEVVVLRSRGTVRLGIQAADEIKIRRKEADNVGEDAAGAAQANEQ